MLNCRELLPQRVVSLQPSVTATLDALGELHRVVACTRYCAELCPSLAQAAPVIVRDSWSAQSREILSANPDLVVASVPYQQEAVTEILKCGIPVLAFSPRKLCDVYKDTVALGSIVGAAESAGELVAGMKAEIERVRRIAEDASERPRVFCEEWGKPIIRSQRWVAELVEAAGGVFVGDPGVTTSSEEVYASRPEVIIAAWCGAGDRVPLQKLITQRQWQPTPAAVQGRVFCISDALLNTPAPTTLIRGLQALAWAIHPRLFPQPEGIREIPQP